MHNGIVFVSNILRVAFAAIILTVLGTFAALAQSADPVPDPAEPAAAATEQQPSPPTRGKTSLVLGVSWLPAFCESGRKKPECAELKEGSQAASQFTLQGLWKNRKSYCDISDAQKNQDKKKDWISLPAPELEGGLQARLAAAMPGVSSGLDRHEWIKHGSCTGLKSAEYFEKSIDLLDQLNGSEVAALFKSNIGKSITEAQVKAAFDAAFGAGSGEKIKMRCRKDGDRQIITGLTVGLAGFDQGDSTLKGLIQGAAVTKFGCAEGVVDAVGQQ